MKRYKKPNLKSRYSVPLAGVVAVLALLTSLGSHTSSFEAQAQYQSQQSSTIILATNNQNMTMAESSSNGTTSSMPNETTTITTATANIPNATLIEFASNIEQIRGHLDQALINKESGNNTLAQAHVLHPIEEVYSSIEEELTNQNSTLNETLSAALKNLSSSVTTTTLEEVRDQTQSINELLNHGLQTVISNPEFKNGALFNASVAAHLLHVSEHEYDEAVSNGTIKAIIEHQDAQAFIQRAESIFNSSASRINPTMTQQVQEVHDGFSKLNSSLSNIAGAETVQTTIDGIIHELAEITGLSESQLIGEEEGEDNTKEHDSVTIINNIKSLLAQLIAAYRSQDYQGAESIAIEAYLENYEYIEAPLAQHDQQLMEQTEVMLRENLRQMIMNRDPIEQIEQHIDMIDDNLDRAIQLLQ
ncbi:MAG: hypothetical protein ACJ701_03030 [Nitrososphaera sp.]